MLPVRKSIYRFLFSSKILLRKNNKEIPRSAAYLLAGRPLRCPRRLTPEFPWQQRFCCARQLQRSQLCCTGPDYRKTAHSAGANRGNCTNGSTFRRHHWLRVIGRSFRNFERRSCCRRTCRNARPAEKRRLSVRITHKILALVFCSAV